MDTQKGSALNYFVRTHGLVVLVFALVTVIYFKDVYFGNMQLSQHDKKMWLGSAKEIRDYREEHGTEPLWTNTSFGGMPSQVVSTLYPGNWYQKIYSKVIKVLPHYTFHIFLMMLCFYIMMLAFDVDYRVASIGAIAYCWASFIVISTMAGHNSKVLAAAYAPLVLAGIRHLYKKNHVKGLFFASVGMSLQLSAGHYQITYYLLFILACYGIYELIAAIKEKTFKAFAISSGIALIAIFIGIIPNWSSIATVQAYSKYSTRGKSELKNSQKEASGLSEEYVFEYSQGSSENFTFLVPNFMGGASGGELDEDSETYKAVAQRGGEAQARNFIKQVPLYHGDQRFVAGPIYIGASICFLFILGMVLLDNKYKWWLFAATVIGFILSLGENSSINYWMLDNFPGYNKFRTVSMAVYIVQFTAAIMATLAIHKVLINEDKDKNLKGIYIAGAVTIAFCLIFILIKPGTFSSKSDANFSQYPWLLEALKKDRKSLMVADSWRSIFVVGVTCLWLFLYAKGQIKLKNALVVLLGLTVLVDLWTVDFRYLNSDNYVEKPKDKNALFVANAIDKKIMQDNELYFRVFNQDNPFNEARTSYFHYSVGGYSGAKLRRYQEMIDTVFTNPVATSKVLQMLNTKYIISLRNQKQPLRQIPKLGNAWFIESLQQVDSPDEERSYLLNNEFNPGRNAVIDITKFPGYKEKYQTSGNSIELTSYAPNELNYKVNAPQNGFAVFSEVYYPDGWKIYIDGKEGKLARVNYILRAAEIPKGARQIKLVYEPDLYYSTTNISHIGSGILLLITLLTVFVYSKKGQQILSDKFPQLVQKGNHSDEESEGRQME